MDTNYYFPFGQKLTKVQEGDTTPDKEVFVLGVYASAVHAKWIGKDGVLKVQALALASEPEIFWTGNNTEEIIAGIHVPEEMGTLIPANKNLNGPSGVALDELFLKPLGFIREQAWLCDLLPESRVNTNQKNAVTIYNEIVQRNTFDLSIATIPDFDEKELKINSEKRKDEILEELEASGAKTIILLGDLPIRWFLHFFDKRKSLSDFDGYGRSHDIEINDKYYSVIPLCHPRNAARLGAFSKKCAELHDEWIREKAC